MPRSRDGLSYLVGDIETSDGLGGTQFRIGAIWDGRRDNPPVLFYSVDSFVSYILSRGVDTSTNHKSIPIVYFHNLDFDGRFIFDYIARSPHNFKFENDGCRIIHNGGLMAMFLTYYFMGRQYRIRIQDSMNLLPAGQASLEEVFLGRKNKVDVDWTKAVSDELIEKRVTEDVKGLWWVLREFIWDIYERFGVDCRKSISLATITMTVFRTSLSSPIYNDFVIPNGIESLEFNFPLDALIRYGYFGGRTEVFGNFDLDNFPENYDELDANSLYPSQYHKVMPVGKFEVRELRNQELPPGEGFFIGSLYEEYSEYPVMPSKSDEGKLIYGYGHKYGVWAFPELRRAQELNLITLKSGYFLVSDNAQPILKDLGDQLYQERLKFREEGNVVGAFMNKILLNSLYGKFGQSPEFTNLFLIPGRVDYDEIPLGQELHAYDNGDYAVTMLKYTDVKFDHYMMVSIASYITSYARVDLHRAIQGAHDKGGRITYCDTDSIHGIIPEGSVTIGSELGEWKPEYHKITKAQYFLPKLYWVESIDESGKLKSTCKAKGFPKTLFKNQDGTERYTSLIEFFDIISKGFQQHKYLTFRQALIRGSRILSDQMFSRTVKMVQTDKRKWLTSGKSVPLRLEEDLNRLQEVHALFEECFGSAPIIIEGD